MRSYTMPRLPTHLVQELNVGTVAWYNVNIQYWSLIPALNARAGRPGKYTTARSIANQFPGCGFDRR